MALCEAYQVLSNAERRRKYDAGLAAAEVTRVLGEVQAAPRGKPYFAIGFVAVAIAVGLLGWKMKSVPKVPAAPQAVMPAAAPASMAEKAEVPGGEAPAVEKAPGTAAIAEPQPRASSRREKPARDFFDYWWPAVVRVSASDVRGGFLAQGSGVVLSGDSVLTACHLVSGAHKVQVKMHEQPYPATVVLADEELDLCRLRVRDFDPRVPERGTASDVAAGQRVYVLGASWQTLRASAVAIVDELVEAPNGPLMRLSIPLPPAWDGGAVFTPDGLVVGMLTTRHGLGGDVVVAVPIDRIAEMKERPAARAIAAQTPASMKKLLPGTWRCIEMGRDRSRTYQYSADGHVVVAIDGITSGTRYRLEGASVRHGSASQPVTLQIETIDESHMVQYHAAGERLSCERVN